MHFYHSVSSLLNYTRNSSGNFLLGDGFLERGNAIMIQGSSGAGKSKTTQAWAGSFAAGIEFLGVRPTAPLNVLYIQAEDTVDDLAESMQGFSKHTLNSEDDLVEQLEKNLTIVTVVGQSGDEFLAWVDKACDLHKPDILVVDPLLAFIGCDLVDQKAVTRFLRSQLQPILIRHNCGFIGVHHKRKKSDGPDIDQSLGSMEFSAFFRGIISINVPETRHQEMTIKVAKRQRQMGWRDEAGRPTDTKYVLKGDDGIYFTEVSGFEASTPKTGGRPRRVNAAVVANFIRAEQSKGAADTDVADRVAKQFNYSPKQAKRYVAEVKETQTEFKF